MKHYASYDDKGSHEQAKNVIFIKKTRHSPTTLTFSGTDQSMSSMSEHSPGRMRSPPVVHQHNGATFPRRKICISEGSRTTLPIEIVRLLKASPVAGVCRRTHVSSGGLGGGGAGAVSL